MTREECIERLQEIVDQDKNKILVRVHVGYLIHAIKYLKEQEQEKNVYTWICPECDSQIVLKVYKANKAIGMSFDCCPVCGKKVLYGKAD